VFRGIAPTERGGYSLREMAQQDGPFEYFNRLLALEQGSRSLGALRQPWDDTSSFLVWREGGIITVDFERLTEHVIGRLAQRAEGSRNRLIA